MVYFLITAVHTGMHSVRVFNAWLYERSFARLLRSAM